MLRAILTLTLAASIAILGLVFTPFGVLGQPQCAARTEQLIYLKEVFGETPIAEGISGPNSLLIITANTETGTWSILTQTGNGPACFRAVGEAWRLLTQLPGIGL